MEMGILNPSNASSKSKEGVKDDVTRREWLETTHIGSGGFGKGEWQYFQYRTNTLLKAYAKMVKNWWKPFR